MQEIYKWKDVPLDYFSIDDYMNMNKGIEMIKFNPNQVTRIKKAEGIDFYSDFSYYEMYDSSIIRDFPVNFFYNKSMGYFFELNKTNAPIYNLSEKATPRINLNDMNAREEEIFLVIKKYFKFFFDNVAGKHGYFHIIQDFEDIKKITKLYFDNNNEKLILANQILNKLEANGNLHRLDSLIQKTFVIKSNSSKFEIMKGLRGEDKVDNNWFKTKNNGENVFRFNAFLLFQGTLFNTNIEVSTKFINGIQRFSNISLSSERDIYPTSSKVADPVNIELKELGFESFLPPFHLLR